MTTTPPTRLALPMSAVETQPMPATRLNLGYDKNLMLFTGRANPELASRIAGKLGIARERQSNIEGYVARKRGRRSDD